MPANQRTSLRAIREALTKADRWTELHKEHDARFPDGWATHMMTTEDDREYGEGYQAIEFLRTGHLEALCALLAVAEAAKALMKASPNYDTYKQKEDALKKALKALEE